MMELKNYQKLVLKDIDAYLDALMKTDGINAAWKEYWASKGIGSGFAAYCDDLGGAPNVCIKVPTGGGKTFLAASSVKTVFDKLPTGKTKFVVWLVPSDAILTQTVANLSNPNHPYRQRLNMDFGGCVNVFENKFLVILKLHRQPSSKTQRPFLREPSRRRFVFFLSDTITRSA